MRSFTYLSQTGIVEMTWVISDYVAAQGSSELSVLKGQQVEVIDTNCLGAPDYCLVRLTNGSTSNNVSTASLSSSSTQEQIIQEGLVPSSILKPPPTQSTKSRRAGEGEEGELASLRTFGDALTCHSSTLIRHRCKHGDRNWQAKRCLGKMSQL